MSGLPANLTQAPVGSAGMAPLQKPAHALVSAIRHRATPLAIDPSVTAEGVEDDSTNAALAVFRLTDQLDLLAQLIAVELVCAAQAVDLAEPGRMGGGTGETHEAVRALVPPLGEDRQLSGGIAAVLAIVA